MKRALATVTFLVLGGLTLPRTTTSQDASSPPPVRGFSAERGAEQREWERKLQRLPDPASAERHLRFLTAQPHMAGTEGSRRVAEYVRDRLRDYGFEAELARYTTWLPHPVEINLELIAPEPRALATPEDPVAADPASGDARAVGAFHGYSASGEATAPVVYVNYGLPDDYRQLADLGISAAGRIVLARYGRSFRGVKAKVAEENGAAGLLLFSDPADDGYVAGDPYPRGPWRPVSGIQRGSVYYGFFYPGDPLTPGTPSTDGTPRIPPEKAESLPRIPTMPINARDAVEILKHLNGPRVPRAWQGGLPLTYHTGPGQAVVRLKVVADYQQRALYNVVGKLRGVSDDEWVVYGNHHDAWVFGAVDPSSGTAVLLETARALGELARAGWKPRRTIVLCAWDGEEFGLLGSTEWVEENLAELRRKAVAYLNIDSAVSGPNFGASGTPSLKEVVREAAREVTDPRTGRTVYDAWRERVLREAAKRAGGNDVPLGDLGSGSDYTPFFHHAGIPSLDMGSGGEYGVYHSIYDSFHWMKTFGDPEFLHHATMARMAGIVMMRLAGADVLPFDYAAYGAEVLRHVSDLEGRVKAQGEGKLDLRGVREAAAAFSSAGARAQKALAANAGRAGLNRALARVEQELLNPEGLVGRPWYKHTVYAPGRYAGYDVAYLPGVREATDRGDWETARREADALAAALRRAAARLDEVARLAASKH
jgi:N-acetylated-alpha-linked acidic dipeptidase